MTQATPVLGDVVATAEGYKKAEKIASTYGVRAVASSSGAEVSQTLGTVERLGAGIVIQFPDADVRTNAGIATARANEHCAYLARGIQVHVAHWPTTAGKGADDVIVGGQLVGDDIESMAVLPGRQDEIQLLHGLVAVEFLADCVRAAKAPKHEGLEARKTLHNIVERVKAACSEAFRPDVVEAFARLAAASVERNKLDDEIRGVLGAKARAFTSAVKAAEEKQAKEERARRIEELKRQGKVVLIRGDQTEIRDIVLERLTHNPKTGESKGREHLVFDRGNLWRLTQGVHVKVDPDVVVNEVTRLAGSPIGEQGRLLVNAGTAKGVVMLLTSYCAEGRKEYFDAAPHGVAFKNGFLRFDLRRRSAKVEPLSQVHRARNPYAFEYEPGRTPEKILAMMRRLFAGPECVEKVQCFRELAGSGLCGLGRAYAKALVLRGKGNNGKSTLLKLLYRAAGKEAVSTIAPADLSGEYNMAALEGKLLNIVFDLDERTIFDSGKFKAATTGDPVRARDPYGKPYDHEPIAAHLMACNKLPPTNDTTLGFRRRWIVLDTAPPIPTGEVNEFIIEDTLADELPDFICWLIDGAIERLGRNHFTVPKSSDAAVNEWLFDADHTQSFFAECVSKLTDDEIQDKKKWTGSSGLYAAYVEWARANGHTKTVTSTTFGKKIKEYLDHEGMHTKRGRKYPCRLHHAETEDISGDELERYIEAKGIPATSEVATDASIATLSKTEYYHDSQELLLYLASDRGDEIKILRRQTPEQASWWQSLQDSHVRLRYDDDDRIAEVKPALQAVS